MLGVVLVPNTIGRMPVLQGVPMRWSDKLLAIAESRTSSNPFQVRCRSASPVRWVSTTPVGSVRMRLIGCPRARRRGAAAPARPRESAVCRGFVTLGTAGRPSAGTERRGSPHEPNASRTWCGSTVSEVRSDPAVRRRRTRPPASVAKPRHTADSRAEPVLQRLGDELEDSRSASSHRSDRRRTHQRTATRPAPPPERVELVPGFSYGEQFSDQRHRHRPEDGNPTYVFGHEHYAEHLEDLACAGCRSAPDLRQDDRRHRSHLLAQDAGGLLVALAARPPSRSGRHCSRTATFGSWCSSSPTCRPAGARPDRHRVQRRPRDDERLRPQLLAPADQSLLLASATRAWARTSAAPHAVPDHGSKVGCIAGGYPAARGEIVGGVLSGKLIERDEDSAASRCRWCRCSCRRVGSRRCGCGAGTTSTPPTAAVSGSFSPASRRREAHVGQGRTPAAESDRPMHTLDAATGDRAPGAPRFAASCSTTRWTRW